MIPSIVVTDAGGARTIGEADLPLQIGSGAAADIRVPGLVSDTSPALIGQLDGRPFVQLAPSASGVSVNGEALASTRWLESGDEVQLSGAAIRCEFGDSGWAFTVTQQRADYATVPPELVSDDADDAEIVAPIRRGTVKTEVDTPGGSLSKIKWIGGGALALLLLVALYLLFAKAVLINTEPATAEVKIAGGLIKPKIDQRYLLLPGDYRVLLSAEGYEPAREAITVGAGASQDFRFEMQKLPGLFSVTTARPAVGRVQIDGRDAGQLPVEAMELPAGPHIVNIVAERYLPFEETVEVEGLGQRQDYVADLVPGWADVMLTTAPGAATVFVGDEEQGETPLTLELMPGAHEIAIRKQGFKTWRTTVTAVASEPQELPTVELTEADSLLSVITRPSGAAVSVNGRFRGTSPIDVELSPGTNYAVNISKAGYTAIKRNVRMEPKQSRTLRLDLEARIGIVRITADPPDAELLVDGVVRGRAAQELSLPARPHRIEVRKAGLATYKTEVTPRPGFPEVLDIKLLTPEQAVLAATPQTIKTSQNQVLRLVSPGTLELGAPRREQGRRNNEVQRKVTLTRPFYIGLKEITNSEFRKFKPKHTSGAEKYRGLATGDHPAVMMTWSEAVGYCNWLSNKESLPPAYVVVEGKIQLTSPPNDGYRLPTEAEWAWVARYNAGGREQKYPWGERMPPTRGAGNFADQSSSGIVSNVLASYNDGHPVTAPVGSFSASPLGLFDLGGNAAEWVTDRYSATSFGADLTDPVGPVEGQYHVIRGSGWRHASISELRFAYRDFGERGRLDVGFRLARYAGPDKQE